MTKQLPQNSGVYLSGEYITPDKQGRGNMLLVGFWVVAAIGLFAASALFIFREALAPVIVWTGILSGTAFVLFVSGAGVYKILGYRSKNKTIDEINRLEIAHRRAEVDKLKAEALQQLYIARQEQLQAMHLTGRLHLVTIDHKEALYNLNTGELFYIPPTVAERNLLAPQEIVSRETLPRLLDVLHSGKPWDNPLYVFGGQGSGKTTTAVAVAHSLDLPTIFIGFRPQPGLYYPKMTTYIYEPDCRTAVIERGVAAALKSLQDFEPGIIFIDDLMDVNEIVDIEGLVSKCARQAVSHNKRVIVTTHTEAKEGAGFKNASAQLRIFFANLTILQPEIDNNLQPMGHPQTAMLAKPGNWKDSYQVRLPGPVTFAPVDSEQEFANDVKLLRLGETSKTKLCHKYYHGKNDKIMISLNDRLRAHGYEP